MASSLDAGLRRKVSWLLNLEGDFNAQVDDGIAKIKALGLSVTDTNARIKAYKDQRAAAAEADRVSTQNLLGEAAAFGLLVAGFERGKAAIERWVDSVQKSNEHLEKLDINTGEAGFKIDTYSKSIDTLSTSFDKLNVALGGGVLEKMGQAANILSKLVDYGANHAQDLENAAWSAFTTAFPAAAALAGSAAAVAGAGLDAASPPGSSGPPSILPDPYGLLGPLNVAPKKWVPYQKRGIGLPGVSYQTDPAFLDYMNGTLPFGGGANFAGSSVGGPLLDQSTMAAMAAAASTLGAPPRTPHPVTAQGFASVLGGFGGGLASGLSALGPAGMAVGAVAGLAPHLGQTFDSLFSQADHLPAQLMRGLDHIIDRLPDIFTKLLPDLIYGLAQLIPNLVDALVVKLPVALAKAIHDAFLGGNGSGASPAARSYFGRRGGSGLRGNDANQYLEDQAFFSGAGGAGLNRTRDVHIHTHGSVPDQIRAIKKALGSYGNGYDLTPPVTH